MTSAPLYVHFENHLIGELKRNAEGSLQFAYDATWVKSAKSFSLSLVLPVRAETFHGRPVESFFENLIPEGQSRRRIEQLTGIAQGNDIEYLKRFGADCAGAISLHTHKIHPPPAASSARSVIEISEGVFRKIIEDDEPLHLAAGLPADDLPRFSLAGAQAKFPCLLEGNKILLARAGAPTTHIVKLPIRAGKNLIDSVPNEFINMRLAALCNLPTPQVQILGKTYPVYVVERFDRQLKGSTLHRLHSQDFCQALGVPSREKYENHGGPTLGDCYKVIADNSAESSRDLLVFIDWIAFNLAIGNNDSHAKNISLIMSPEGIRLAPFYDLVATVLYPQFNMQFAFSIGGVRGWERIRFEHISTLAREFGLKPAFLGERWKKLFARLESKVKELEDVIKGETKIIKTLRKIAAQIDKRTKHMEKYALTKA